MTFQSCLIKFKGNLFNVQKTHTNECEQQLGVEKLIRVLMKMVLNLRDGNKIQINTINKSSKLIQIFVIESWSINSLNITRLSINILNQVFPLSIQISIWMALVAGCDTKLQQCWYFWTICRKLSKVFVLSFDNN